MPKGKSDIATLYNIDDIFEENNTEFLDAYAHLAINQQRNALDLTRIILEHCQLSELNEDKVLSIYEKAIKTIIACSPGN